MAKGNVKGNGQGDCEGKWPRGNGQGEMAKRKSDCLEVHVLQIGIFPKISGCPCASLVYFWVVCSDSPVFCSMKAPCNCGLLMECLDGCFDLLLFHFVMETAQNCSAEVCWSFPYGRDIRWSERFGGICSQQVSFCKGKLEIVPGM